MSTHDPYEAPQAALDVADSDDDGFLREPRALPAGAALEWIAAGWRSFTLAPWPWIGILVVFTVLVMVASVLPLISLFANLLTTVLLGGIMLGCDAQHRGEPLDVSHLFAGFSRNAAGLVAVGALYLVGTVVLMLFLLGLMFAFFGGLGMFTGNTSPDMGAVWGGFAVLFAVALALGIPLAMTFVYAPALVAIKGLGPVDAMTLSFRACLRNLLPWIVFFLVAIGLGIVATLPLLLGWLVLSPVLMAATYAAYRDTFYAG
jgi:uncharacterized membrane protein